MMLVADGWRVPSRSLVSRPRLYVITLCGLSKPIQCYRGLAKVGLFVCVCYRPQHLGQKAILSGSVQRWQCSASLPAVPWSYSIEEHTEHDLTGRLFPHPGPGTTRT